MIWQQNDDKMSESTLSGCPRLGFRIWQQNDYERSKPKRVSKITKLTLSEYPQLGFTIWQQIFKSRLSELVIEY